VQGAGHRQAEVLGQDAVATEAETVKVDARPDPAADDPQQGRFARAGWPGDQHDATGIQAELQVVEQAQRPGAVAGQAEGGCDLDGGGRGGRIDGQVRADGQPRRGGDGIGPLIGGSD